MAEGPTTVAVLESGSLRTAVKTAEVGTPPAPPKDRGKSPEGTQPEDRTDYSKYLEKKSIPTVTVSPKGETTTKESPVVNLSLDGRRAADRAYVELSRQNNPQATIDALKQKIRDHDKAPAHERVLSEDQRIYYEKLINFTEAKLRTQEVIVVKDEISIGGNGWEKVVQTRVSRALSQLQPPRGFSPSELDAWRNEQTRVQTIQVQANLSTGIQSLREKLVSSIAEATPKERDSILRAVQLLEQKKLSGLTSSSDLLDIDGIYGVEESGFSEGSRDYFIHLVREQVKKEGVAEPVGTTDAVLEVLSNPQPEKVEKKSGVRKKLAQTIASGLVVLGLLVGVVGAAANIPNPYQKNINKVITRVVENPGKAYESAQQVIEYQSRLLQRQKIQHDGLEALEAEVRSGVEEAGPFATTEEKQVAILRSILKTAKLRDCMRVWTPETHEVDIVPNWPGKPGESVSPVVTYDWENINNDPVCQTIFGNEPLPENHPMVQQFSTLIPLESAEAARDSNLQEINYKLNEDQKLTYRQTGGGTCYFTAASSIVSQRMLEAGLTPVSPLTLAELLDLSYRVREITSPDNPEMKAPDYVNPKGGLSMNIDFSSYNRQIWDFQANQALFEAMGIKLKFDRNYLPKELLADENGNLLNLDNFESTTHDPAFWKNRGIQLAKFIEEAKKQGGSVIVTSIVEKENIPHSMQLYGIKYDEAGTPILQVIETANRTKVTGAEWTHTRGHWRTTDSDLIMDIPLDDEVNVRAILGVKNASVERLDADLSNKGYMANSESTFYTNNYKPPSGVVI